MEKVKKNGKWQSRRWLTALFGIVLVIADKIYCVEKGLDIEWFKTFTSQVVLLALFGTGFITATHMMHAWKEKKNNDADANSE